MIYVACPICGSDYTHHGDVEVYVRDREDGESQITLVNAKSKKTALMRDELKANPSGRRGGIRIWFECEAGCQETFSITFAQHKGQTEVFGLKLIEL